MACNGWTDRQMNGQTKKVTYRGGCKTVANLKNLLYSFCVCVCVSMCVCDDDAIPLLNFEFQKKIVPLLTKDFDSQSFHSCKFFHERVSCVKNVT